MKKFNYKKIILLVVALYVGFIFINQQITIFRQHRDIQKYTGELQTAQEEKQKLEDEIKLSEDKAYIEKIAREKLGLVKKGESSIMDSK